VAVPAAVADRVSKLSVNIQNAKKIHVVYDDITEDLGLAGVFTMRFLDNAMERDFQKQFVERRLSIARPASLSFSFFALLVVVMNCFPPYDSVVWFRRSGSIVAASGFAAMYVILRTVSARIASLIYDPFMLTLLSLVVFIASMTADRTAKHFEYDSETWSVVALQEANSSLFIGLVLALTALVARPRLSWMIVYYLTCIAIATACPLHYGSVEYDLMAQATQYQYDEDGNLTPLWSHTVTVLLRNGYLVVIAIVAYIVVYHNERRERVTFATLYLISLRKKAEQVRAEKREFRARALERRAEFSRPSNVSSCGSSPRNSFGVVPQSQEARASLGVLNAAARSGSREPDDLSPNSTRETFSEPLAPVPALQFAVGVEVDDKQFFPELAAHISQSKSKANLRRVCEKLGKGNCSTPALLSESLDCIPELALFFIAGHEDHARFDRTLTMVLVFHWLSSCSHAMSREAFCYGVNHQAPKLNYSVKRAGTMQSSQRQEEYEASDDELHQMFHNKMEWPLCDHLSQFSGCASSESNSAQSERKEVMMCVLLLWNLLRLPVLEPRVRAEHAPFKHEACHKKERFVIDDGIESGALLQKPNLALAYLSTHYPDLFPCYEALKPQDKDLVLRILDQEDFQFVSFVQAEGTPGSLLRELKGSFINEAEVGMYLFFWVIEHASRESSFLQGASKFIERYPPHLFADILQAIPSLVQLPNRTETEVMEGYLMQKWNTTKGPQQTECFAKPEILACRRLVLMAQDNQELTMAFDMLLQVEKDVLQSELARTGLRGQHFSELHMPGGPALVLRDSAIFLQQHAGSSRRDIYLALRIIVAIGRAARLIWPAEETAENTTVIVSMTALRTADVSTLLSPLPGKFWLLVRTTDTWAQVEHLRAGEINDLSADGVPFQVLDFSCMGEEQPGLPERPQIQGKWKCVETWGMDEFLKSMGIGKLQRMAAAKAPWPSWQFTQDGDQITFTNKTAMGDIRETFVADGSEYTMVDGYKRNILSQATWQVDALVITRSGPEGRSLEERKVTGDKLFFRLAKLNENGEEVSGAPQWGRVFERSS